MRPGGLSPGIFADPGAGTRPGRDQGAPVRSDRRRQLGKQERAAEPGGCRWPPPLHTANSRRIEANALRSPGGYRRPPPQEGLRAIPHARRRHPEGVARGRTVVPCPASGKALMPARTASRRARRRRGRARRRAPVPPGPGRNPFSKRSGAVEEVLLVVERAAGVAVEIEVRHRDAEVDLSGGADSELGHAADHAAEARLLGQGEDASPRSGCRPIRSRRR